MKQRLLTVVLFSLLAGGNLFSAQLPCRTNLLDLELTTLIQNIASFWIDSVQKTGQTSTLRSSLEETFRSTAQKLARDFSLSELEVLRRIDIEKAALLLGHAKQPLASSVEDQLKKETNSFPLRYVKKNVLKTAGPSEFAVFSPKGDTLLTPWKKAGAALWNINRPTEPLVVYNGHTNNVVSGCFSHKGEFVLTASADKTAKLWNVSDGASPLTTFEGHNRTVRSAVFCPNDETILTASDDLKILFWKPDCGQAPIHPLPPEVVYNYALYSPDGRTFLAYTIFEASLWNVDDLSTKFYICEMAMSAAFSPNGDQILIGCGDGTAKLYDAAKPQTTLRLYDGHYRGINSVGFSADGKFILTSSKDGCSKVWAIDEPSEPLLILDSGALVYTSQFSPDGQLIVTTEDGEITLWEKVSP